MNETSMDRLNELLVAATEFVRAQAPYVVSINEVLDELSDRFPDRFQVSDEVIEVFKLIAMLWDDPRIEAPHIGWIEFAWSEERSDRARDANGPLRTYLLQRLSQSELATSGSASTFVPDEAIDES